MATTQQFKDYVKANASKLDKSKLSGLTPEQNKSLFNEWKTSGSLPKNYFTPVTAPAAKPAVNTPVKPTNNTSSTFGQTAATNPGTAKVESTISAFDKKQSEAAKATEEALMSNAAKQVDVIKDSTQGARDRYAGQQEQLDKNKARAEDADLKRREQASKIVQRQDEIATRQANIAAARAGQGGVQLSDSDMQDIKDDVIAKYGENIANAEQFALQTNMTLDQALTNLDSTIFKDKQAIDNFVNQLDEKEKAPLLTALAEAAKGNVQAITDAKNLYNALATKKADEEAGRMLETERLEDWQRQWVGMDQRQKGDWLFSRLGENAWVLDEYRENPNKYKNMSATEALHTLQKIAVQRGELGGNAGLQIYIQLKSQAEAAGQPFAEIPAYEKLLSQGDAALRQTDATAEAKTEQRGTTGTSTTPLTNTFGLSANNRKQLDDALAKYDKAKIISALKGKLDSGNLSRDSYDKTIKYLNSK